MKNKKLTTAQALIILLVVLGGGGIAAWRFFSAPAFPEADLSKEPLYETAITEFKVTGPDTLPTAPEKPTAPPPTPVPGLPVSARGPAVMAPPLDSTIKVTDDLVATLESAGVATKGKPYPVKVAGSWSVPPRSVRWDWDDKAKVYRLKAMVRFELKLTPDDGAKQRTLSLNGGAAPLEPDFDLTEHLKPGDKTLETLAVRQMLAEVIRTWKAGNVPFRR
ncbi:hypothetical protein [Armatimonas rosea]|uniref:Uncharacterized protein n=1 Tax=Armatimonas rosea TaxID=685828 RepID=A0A7W9SVD9_ARMRO|nr:hypothetical protein [Armatimonas rosea]MBB6053561.1 hypothetical protein [Armatimonas rosea]